MLKRLLLAVLIVLGTLSPLAPEVARSAEPIPVQKKDCAAVEREAREGGRDPKSFFLKGRSLSRETVISSSHELGIAAGSGFGISIKGKIRLWINRQGQPRAKIL